MIRPLRFFSYWQDRQNCGTSSGCSGMRQYGSVLISTVSCHTLTGQKPKDISYHIWSMPGEGRISSQTGHWTISIKNLPGYRGASTASAKRAWCMPASRENAWSMNIWCVISLNTKCWEVMSDMGFYYQCSDPDSNEKNWTGHIRPLNINRKEFEVTARGSTFHLLLRLFQTGD